MPASMSRSSSRIWTDSARHVRRPHSKVIDRASVCQIENVPVMRQARLKRVRERLKRVCTLALVICALVLLIGTLALVCYKLAQLGYLLGYTHALLGYLLGYTLALLGYTLALFDQQIDEFL